MSSLPESGPLQAATSIAVLEARNVYRFRAVEKQQVPIVRDVSFRVDAGEFVSIMGPSGSGKSTLLHLLAGLEPPTSGDVFLQGERLGGADEERLALLRRSKIGFIFQFFHLLPDLTVWENVTLPLRILGKNPKKHSERVRATMDMLSIGALADRKPQALSGGEMQRVSIARALASEPPLLLCDEPTGNLSSKHGEEVVALLSTVRKQLGTAILLVTHNPRDAAAADRVLFLHDGAMRAETALTGGPFDVADVFRRLQALGI